MAYVPVMTIFSCPPLLLRLHRDHAALLVVIGLFCRIIWILLRIVNIDFHFAPFRFVAISLKSSVAS